MEHIIARESIFTGVNNPYVNTILTADSGNERFGFTPQEVLEFLETAGLQECGDIVSQWYDGCLFGEKEICNPISVALFVAATLGHPRHVPQAIDHWANTSGNDNASKGG